MMKTKSLKKLQNLIIFYEIWNFLIYFKNNDGLYAAIKKDNKDIVELILESPIIDINAKLVLKFIFLNAISYFFIINNVYISMNFMELMI